MFLTILVDAYYVQHLRSKPLEIRTILHEELGSLKKICNKYNSVILF